MPAADVKAVEAERRATRLTPAAGAGAGRLGQLARPLGARRADPHLAGANQSAGQDLFSLNCAACHTITGSGDALAFGTNAPSLQNRSVTAQQVVEAIRTGPANMPRFSGNLTDAPGGRHRLVRDRPAAAPDEPRRRRARWRGPGGRGLRRPADRRRRPRPHLLLDRRALVSDADHQPSRTRVPMPVAALSDPHMGDAAKNPERTEKIIAVILVLASSSSPLFGAAYVQNWRPWILGGTLGVGLFFLGFGLTAWGKYLMPQGPFVEERHTLASTPGGARRHVGRPGRAFRRRRQAAQDAGRPLRRRAPASSALWPPSP